MTIKSHHVQKYGDSIYYGLSIVSKELALQHQALHGHFVFQVEVHTFCSLVKLMGKLQPISADYYWTIAVLLSTFMAPSDPRVLLCLHLLDENLGKLSFSRCLGWKISHSGRAQTHFLGTYCQTRTCTCYCCLPPCFPAPLFDSYRTRPFSRGGEDPGKHGEATRSRLSHDEKKVRTGTSNSMVVVHVRVYVFRTMTTVVLQ